MGMRQPEDLFEDEKTQKPDEHGEKNRPRIVLRNGLGYKADKGCAEQRPDSIRKQRGRQSLV
jgi:hypothetical protein